ncbi:SPASM domain-containing protein [Sulfurimonas sp. SAG-AH-194-I05]|nr:SPASM domain-containing protein [Sulfurimonas sp. SAG-AH-194-I05]MDF1875769.1 SPASM domain-containing protein [Sulfurimonas sp. SAG-AH-194-I05]
MNPKETIKKNLARVDKLIDENIHFHKGMPLFSWLELSPVDMCNRTCSFCPKSDDSIAPNTHNHMSDKLYTKLASELKSLDYKGTVMLAGYGEPMMHKNFVDIVQTFSKVCNTEMTVNGDFLTVKAIEKLDKAGINKIIISMYDSVEQIEKFHAMFAKANVTKEKYILRDRWYTENEDFGVKLTNRAGVLDFGHQPEVDAHKPCYYPHYSMMIDWNGDCYLCTQDWSRRMTTGNIMFSSVVEVWGNATLKKYRTHLSNGERDLSPCKNCNAVGTLHGEKYQEEWKKFYAK